MFYKGPSYLNYYDFITHEHLTHINQIFYPYIPSLQYYSLHIGVENTTTDSLFNWIKNQCNNPAGFFVTMFFENNAGNIHHLFCALFQPNLKQTTSGICHYFYDSESVNSVEISKWAVISDSFNVFDGNDTMFLLIPSSAEEGFISVAGRTSSNNKVHIVYFSAIQLSINNNLYAELINKTNIFFTDCFNCSDIISIFGLQNNRLPGYENLYSFVSNKNPIVVFVRCQGYEIAIYFEISPFGFRKDKIFEYINDNKKVKCLFYDLISNQANQCVSLDQIPISNFRNILEDNSSNTLLDFIYFNIDSAGNLCPNFEREKFNYGNYQLIVYTCMNISQFTVYRNQNNINGFNNYFMMNCMIKGDAMLSNSHFYFRDIVNIRSLEYLYSEVKNNKIHYWFNLILNFNLNDSIYIILPFTYNSGNYFDIPRIHIIRRIPNSAKWEWIEHRLYGCCIYFEKNNDFIEFDIKNKLQKSFFKLTLYYNTCQERCYDINGSSYDYRVASWLSLQSIDEKTNDILIDIGQGYENLGFPHIFPTQNDAQKDNRKKLLLPIYENMEILLYRKNSSIPETKYLYNYTKPTLMLFYQRFFANELQRTVFIKKEDAKTEEKIKREDIIKQDYEFAHNQISQEKKELENKMEQAQEQNKNEKQTIERVKKEVQKERKANEELKKELKSQEFLLNEEKEKMAREKEKLEKDQNDVQKMLDIALRTQKEAEESVKEKEKELENTKNQLNKLLEETMKAKKEIEDKYNQEKEKILEQNRTDMNFVLATNENYVQLLEKRKKDIAEVEERYNSKQNEVINLQQQIQQAKFQIDQDQVEIDEKNKMIDNLKKQIKRIENRSAADIVALKYEYSQEKAFLENTLKNFGKEIQNKQVEIQRNKEEYNRRVVQLESEIKKALKTQGTLHQELLVAQENELKLRESNDKKDIELLKRAEEHRKHLQMLKDAQDKLKEEEKINDRNANEISRLLHMLELMQKDVNKLSGEKASLESTEIKLRKQLNDTTERFANELQNVKDQYDKKFTDLRREIDKKEMIAKKYERLANDKNPEFRPGPVLGLIEPTTPVVKKGYKDGTVKKGTGNRKKDKDKKDKKRFKKNNEKTDEGEIIEEEKKTIQFKDKSIDFYKIIDGTITEKETVKEQSNIDKQIDTDSDNELKITDGSELFSEWSNILNTIDNRRNLEIVKLRVEESVKNTPFSLSSMKDNMFSLAGIFFNIYQIILTKSEFYYLCVFPIVLYNRIEFIENIYNPQTINVEELEKGFKKIEQHMKKKEIEDECALTVKGSLGKDEKNLWKKMTSDYEFLGLKFDTDIPRFVCILLEQSLELNDHSLLLSILICCYHTYKINSIKTLINNENANTYLGYNPKSKDFLITRRSIETFTSVSSLYPVPKTTSRIFKKDKDKIFNRLKNHFNAQTEELFYINLGKKDNETFYKKFDIVLSQTEMSELFKNNKYDDNLKKYLVTEKNFEPFPLLQKMKFLCIDDEDKMYKKIFDTILDHSSSFDKIIVPYKYFNRDSESILEICSESFFSIQYAMWIYFNELHTFICEGYNSIIDKNIAIRIVELEDEEKIIDSMGDMRFSRSNIYTITLNKEKYNLLMTPNIRYLYSAASDSDKKILLAESQYLLSELLKIVKKGKLQITKYQDLDFVCGDQALFMIDFYIKKKYEELLKIDDFKRKFYDLIYIGLWLADQHKKKTLNLIVEKSALYLFYETYKIDSIKNLIEFNFSVTVDRYKELIINELDTLKRGFRVVDAQHELNDFIFNYHTVVKKDDDLILFTPLILIEMYFKTSNHALMFMIYYINFINLEFSRYSLKRGNNYGPLNNEWSNLEYKVKGKPYYYEAFCDIGPVLLEKTISMLKGEGKEIKFNSQRIYAYKPFNKFNFLWSVETFSNSISTRVICENYTLFDGLEINSKMKETYLELAKNKIDELQKTQTLNVEQKTTLSYHQSIIKSYEKKKESITTMKSVVLQYQSANTLKKKETGKYDILNPYTIKTAANSFTEVRFDLLLENYDAHFSSVLYSSISYYKDLKEEITEKYLTKNNAILKTFYNALKELAEHKVANVNIDEYESVNFSGVDISGFQKFVKEKDTFFDCINKYYILFFLYGKNCFAITRDEFKKFITDGSKFYAHRYSQRYEDYELLDTTKSCYLKFDCGKNGTLYGGMTYYHFLLRAMYMNDYEFIYFLVREGNLNYNKHLNNIEVSQVSYKFDDISIDRLFVQSNKIFDEDKKKFIEFDYKSLITNKNNTLEKRFNASEEKIKNAIKKMGAFKDDKVTIDEKHKFNFSKYVDDANRRKINTGIKLPDSESRILLYNSEISSNILISKRTSYSTSDENTEYYYTPNALKVYNLIMSILHPTDNVELPYGNTSSNFDSIPYYKLFIIILCEKFPDLINTYIETTLPYTSDFNITNVSELFKFKVHRKNIEKQYLEVEYLYEQLILDSSETIYNNFTNYYPLQYEVEDNRLYFNDLEAEKPKNATLERTYIQIKKYISKFQSHEFGNLPKSFERKFNKLVDLFNNTPDPEYKIYIIRDQMKGKGYMLTPNDVKKVISHKYINKEITRKRIREYYNDAIHTKNTKFFLYTTEVGEDEEKPDVKEFKKDIAMPEGFFLFLLEAEKKKLFDDDFNLYAQARFIFENYAYIDSFEDSPFVTLLLIEEDVFNEDIELKSSDRLNLSKAGTTTENESFIDDEIKSLF